MLERLRKLLASEDGATAVEYALVVSLVLLATVAGFGAVGRGALSLWSDVATAVAGG